MDCGRGSIAPTFSIRASISPARLLVRTRGSAPCATWISRAGTPNAVKPRRTRSSRGISKRVLLAIRSVRSVCAQFVQERLDRRIRFQQSRTQEFAEFPAGLSQFFTGRLEGGVLHRLLMGRAELGALVFSQIGKSGTAFILKLAKGPVGAIGRRLRENVWRE